MTDTTNGDQTSNDPTLPSNETKRFVPALVLTLFADDDGTRQGVELRMEVCANPDCSCTNLFLVGHAFDQPPDGQRVPREPSFDLTYDVATHKLGELEPPGSADEAGLQDGIRRELRRKKAKELLRREFDEARARIAPKADPAYDFSQHEDGTLAAYLEVYTTADYVFFEHEGVEYVLDDAWCVVPGCACDDGVIHVHRMPANIDADGPIVTKSVGAFRFLDGEAIAGTPIVATKLKAAALDEHRRSQLDVRRDRLRVEAARRWRTASAIDGSRRVAGQTTAHDIVRVREKIGRNQRCPCGSGKKYKHCCLRVP